MKSVIVFLCYAASVFVVNANADCMNDRNGNVVCGKGQCEIDQDGKIFCAAAGGGAIVDEAGKVQCGVGYCARDTSSHIWCSKEPGGSAAVDSEGNVKCVGSCEAGSASLCQEAR